MQNTQTQTLNPGVSFEIPRASTCRRRSDHLAEEGDEQGPMVLVGGHSWVLVQGFRGFGVRGVLGFRELRVSLGV